MRPFLAKNLPTRAGSTTQLLALGKDLGKTCAYPAVCSFSEISLSLPIPGWRLRAPFFKSWPTEPINVITENCHLGWLKSVMTFWGHISTMG